MEGNFAGKLLWLIGGFLLVAVIFVAFQAWYQYSNLPQNVPHEIVVSGEGKAYAKPDVATVNLGVHTQASTSQAAVDQNNKIMNDVISAVKNLGVDDKDIQTTAYNLSPQYDYTEKGRIFKGYSLDQQAQVKIRDFSKISDVLDKASSAGANTISDLQFTVDDMEKVRADAREKAIAQAKEKADSLLGAAGLSGGKIINISEGFSPTPQPVAYGLGGGSAMALPSVAPQIQTGQTEVDSTVTLTYQVQ